MASSDNLSDMGQIVRKVGLNPTFLYKTIKLPFTPPWSLTAEILTQTHSRSVPNSECSGGGSEKNLESFFMVEMPGVKPGSKTSHSSNCSQD